MGAVPLVSLGQEAMSYPRSLWDSLNQFLDIAHRGSLAEALERCGRPEPSIIVDS
jgi:hypothetical protein